MHSKKRLWWLVIIVFIVTALITVAWLRSQGPDTPETVADLREFENHLMALVEHGAPPGLSLAVVRDGRTMYSKGFGWADQPQNRLAGPGTVYHWWSVTKVVTAAAILQLQERELLNLDDPVVKYLGFFNVTYPSSSSDTITIRHLLNHSSGLPEPGLKVMYWTHTANEPPLNQTKFLKSVLPDYSKLAFEPGAYTSYSNIGYMVLGALIEQVSGQTYENYVRENILTPLGMLHTDFIYTDKMAGQEAAGSHPLFNSISPLVPFIAGKFFRGIHGNHFWFKHIYTDQTPPTGLIGPVTDAACFMAAILNGGELEGRRILSAESVHSMLYDSYMQTQNDDGSIYRRQGIGWQIYDDNGRKVVKHDGGGVGFSAVMQLYPDENLGLVLFTNDYSCKSWQVVNLAGCLNW